MRRFRRLLLTAAAVAGVAATALTAPTASAATSTATYRVWHWNVAGNTLHKGSTSDGLVSAATSSITNRSADFVSFNELCYQQYKALQSSLIAAGWPADTSNFSRFAQSRPAGTSVCGGESFGNAVFSKYPLSGASRYSLPSDGSAEDRQLMCAALVSHPHVRFCNTHITTSNDIGDGGRPDNVNQLTYVLDVVEDYEAAGDTVLIAGDFNAQPHYGRLNGYYSPSADTVNNPGNTGHYRELDDDDAAACPGYGEWTAEGTPGAPPPCGGYAKIDEIFVRENHLTGTYSGDSLAVSTACTGGAECSDHRILIGTVPVAFTA